MYYAVCIPDVQKAIADFFELLSLSHINKLRHIKHMVLAYALLNHDGDRTYDHINLTELHRLYANFRHWRLVGQDIVLDDILEKLDEGIVDDRTIQQWLFRWLDLSMRYESMELTDSAVVTKMESSIDNNSGKHIVISSHVDYKTTFDGKENIFINMRGSI